MSNLKKILNDGGRLYLHKIGKCNDDNINAVRVAVNKKLEASDDPDLMWLMVMEIYPDIAAQLFEKGFFYPFFNKSLLV